MSRPKRSIIWDMPKDEFEQLVKSSTRIAEILRAFGLMDKGGNSNTVKRRIAAENIDMSHITLGRGSNKGKYFSKRKTNEELFCENSTTKRSVIKRRLLRDNLKPYLCEYCGLEPHWNGERLTLQLEHKNGIPNDNRLENICFLCPNCHSQTPTYAGKNKLAG